MLDGVAQPVQGPDTGVASPGEDEGAGAAHPYHLVEHEVRSQAGQGEVAATLTDDLMCRRRKGSGG